MALPDLPALILNLLDILVPLYPARGTKLREPHTPVFFQCDEVTAAWCWCRLSVVPSEGLLGAFAAETELKLVQFAPQNISNVIWSYATMGITPGEDVQKPWAWFAASLLAPVIRRPGEHLCDWLPCSINMLPAVTRAAGSLPPCRVCAADCRDAHSTAAAAPVQRSSYQGHSVGLCHDWLLPTQAVPGSCSTTVLPAY